MAYSLAQAAKAVSRDRSTLLRMIKIGKLSATRDEASGAWIIEPAELHRVYPPAGPHVENQGDAQIHTPVHTPDPTAQIATLQARLDAAEVRFADAYETIADLRHRLDQADTDRRQALDRLAAAQERIAALLTDQRSTTPTAPVVSLPTSSEPRRR